MQPFPSPLEPLDDGVVGLGEVTVHESIVTSVQSGSSREVTSLIRRSDDTDARREVLRCFGRSDRRVLRHIRQNPLQSRDPWVLVPSFCRITSAARYSASASRGLPYCLNTTGRRLWLIPRSSRNWVTAGFSSASFCWIASAVRYSTSASDSLPVVDSTRPIPPTECLLESPIARPWRERALNVAVAVLPHGETMKTFYRPLSRVVHAHLRPRSRLS